MRAWMYLGMCLSLAATTGWAALAYSQQQVGASGALPQSGQAGQTAIQQGTVPSPQQGAAGTQQGQLNQPGAIGEYSQQPAAGQDSTYGQPNGAGERSMITESGQRLAQPEAMRAAERGELGVWLVGTRGPGVEIRRITSGSAAEQAGLQPGDVILQVNGQWASSPQMVAELVRQIPIGDSATLSIWRNGEQQQLTATMQPAREIYQDDYQVGFRGEPALTSGDMASRTARLEQQLNQVMQELKQLREEVAQIRTARAGQSTTLDGAINRAADRPGFDQIEQNRPQDGSFGQESTAPAAEPRAETDVLETEATTETPAASETETETPAGTETETDSLFE